jgi:hypothetical protein
MNVSASRSRSQDSAGELPVADLVSCGSNAAGSPLAHQGLCGSQGGSSYTMAFGGKVAAEQQQAHTALRQRRQQLLACSRASDRTVSPWISHWMP